MVNLIFQVIGSFKYYTANFTINSKIYNKKPLSSLALYEDIKDSKIIYLTPESLVTFLTKNAIEAKDLLNNETKLKGCFNSELRSFFEKNVSGNIDFEVEIIPSIGIYFPDDKNYSLICEGGIDNIIASIILNNLERIVECEEVIVDVSAGQNVYNVATLEAMRTLQVYCNLKEITKDESKAPYFKIATCPPISTREASQYEYPIQIFPYNVKTFFDLPYKKDDFKPSNLLEKDINIKEELGKKYESYYGQYKDILATTKLAFNAIRYNAPLAFLQLPEFVTNENDLLKNLMEIYNYVENKKIINLNNNKIYVKRLGINRLELVNYLLTIALYSSLKKFKEDIVKDKQTNFEIISEHFPKLYKSKKIGLGLNARMLERDLEEMNDSVECAKKKGIPLKEYVLLKDLFQKVYSYKSEEAEGECKNKKKSNIKRNFFAHSGLENTVTYIKINEEGKIELIYVPSHKCEILNWIRNPES